MSKKTDKFLELYRTYETVLREQGLDYKTREESSEEPLQGRLRICRQIRNYLTHNQDVGFLEVSDLQIKTLEQWIEKQKMESDILKKHCKTLKSSSCNVQDKCEDTIRRMLKLNISEIPVMESNQLVGVISLKKIIQTYLDGTKAIKVNKVPLEKKQIVYLAWDSPMSVVDSYKEIQTFICCTDTGFKDGKILGIYFIKK